MQRLVMPFKRQMMLCGYKNAQYLQHWKYPHYGVDISTIQGNAGKDHTIYASGDGTVVAVGQDQKLGWGIAILYRDALNHNTGESRDLIARYMHLPEAWVQTGETVRAGTPLGPEGKEGTTDYHLHLEFDTDTQWPAYSPQVAGGTFWKRGIDSTVNPSHLLHVGQDQEIVEPTYNPEWLNPEDFAIPKIPGEINISVDDSRYLRLKEKYDALELKHNEVLSVLVELVEKYG